MKKVSKYNTYYTRCEGRDVFLILTEDGHCTLGFFRDHKPGVELKNLNSPSVVKAYGLTGKMISDLKEKMRVFRHKVANGSIKFDREKT